MKVKKTIKIIALLFILSLNLQANDSYHMNHQNMRTHQESFENLSPKQREKVMNLKAEFMHKEFHLNHEMRKLRMELNSCMTKEEIDINEYRELRERAQELKDQRKKLRIEYKKLIFDAIKNSMTSGENP